MQDLLGENLKKKILFAISYLLGEDTKWILLQQAGNIRCSKVISKGISASQKFAARDRRLKLQQSPGAYLRSKSERRGLARSIRDPEVISRGISAIGQGPARKISKKFGPFLDLCVSSLRRGHANLLCIVPILSDVSEETTER